ncbi:LacI family DNA-binding transcriptional regulator [Arthrobacter sp. KNU-44]|uniref:LacI family DNA-binding transcriptional regulator n=1 Tax=Arthrobacter sp. KNU-44 TaxID=3450744 RepID=UPI003F4431DE
MAEARKAKPSARKRVTAYEVAHESGVSQATVSYVLNNTPGQKISEETRKKVLAVRDRLGYFPYEPARTLSYGNSSIVLIVMPDYPLGHVMTALLDYLSEVLTDVGKTLVVHRTKGGQSAVDVARVIAPMALVSMYPLHPDEIETVKRMGILTEELAFGESDAPGVITNPQEDVGRIQAEHLLATGKKVLGYARPIDERLRPFWNPRLEGVRRVCQEAGLPAPVDLALREDGVDAAETLAIWLRNGVNGICAYNDEIALAVLHGARQLGMVVPRECGVVGVDDIPAASISAPPLTTVRLNVHTIAQRIIAGLKLIDGPAEDDRPVSELIMRQSA